MLPFLVTLAAARGSCLFLENHCYLNDANRVTCLLQGDTQPNEPRLDSIIGQTLGIEASGQNGCPTMRLSQTQLLEIYLLPCEGMFKNVEGIVPDILAKQGKLQSPLVTNIPSAGCNQSVFSIKNALLDDDGAKLFRGGIAIQNTHLVNYESDKYIHRPMIKRGGGTFGNDGTCNVVNNGINDVLFRGVELNNEDCVNAQIPSKEMSGALKKYGPDTM